MGGFVVDYLLGFINVLIVLGGIAVQLPQIYKICTTRNVLGLSESAWIMQTFSTGFYCAYNYVMHIPFMTWGDAFFAACEYAVIVGLIWFYGPPASRMSEVHGNIRKIVVLLALVVLLLTVTRKAPGWLTYLMGVSPVPMVIFGRIPQIWEIFKLKTAGQLSFASLGMQCGGNFARIIVALAMVPDPLIILSHLTAFVFNAVPLLQLIHYDILHEDWRTLPKVLREELGAVQKQARTLAERVAAPEPPKPEELPPRRRQVRI